MCMCIHAVAGEFTVAQDSKYADGLRRMFLLLIDNRDQPSGGMHVSQLLTSWIGYTVNWVRYKLSLDNSLSGSRSNIQV